MQEAVLEKWIYNDKRPSLRKFKMLNLYALLQVGSLQLVPPGKPKYLSIIYT